MTTKNPVTVPTAEQLEKMEKTKRKDISMVDPRRIVPDYKFNVRKNYGDPEIREATKASIKANGILDALHVYKGRGEEVYYLTDGFRRLELVNELLEEGVEIARVPVILTSASMEERYVDMFVTGTTKLPLEDIESAEVIRNLTTLGWDKKQLSERLGIKANRVAYFLKLATLPQKIKNQIVEKKVSPLVAVQISDTVEDDNEKIQAVEAAIDQAKEENMKSGGKTAAKATARHAKVLKKNSPLDRAKTALETMDKDTHPNRYTFGKQLIELLENKASEEEFIQFFNKPKKK